MQAKILLKSGDVPQIELRRESPDKLELVIYHEGTKEENILTRVQIDNDAANSLYHFLGDVLIADDVCACGEIDD